MSEQGRLRVERRDGVTLVGFLDRTIEAELAISTLGDELQAIAAIPECRILILNFSNVEFIPSAMLGKLISTNRRMREKGGTMVMCELSENLRTTFRITHLESILDIRATEADALAEREGER